MPNLEVWLPPFLYASCSVWWYLLCAQHTFLQQTVWRACSCEINICMLLRQLERSQPCPAGRTATVSMALWGDGTV